MSAREYQDTGAVYRVTLDRLHADGIGAYMSQTFGPYSSLATAKSQASRLYRDATTGYRKAAVRIEYAHTYWEEVTP